ncbi:MAG: hypothetical protein ACI9UN_005413 [Granulosicoccus sp.]|jgi:hypothetical protein
MITKTRLQALVGQELIASVRVVPIPMESSWCVDAIIRMPMKAGSTTDTLAKQVDTYTGSTTDKLCRFSTIDQAAEFLTSVGIRMFTVDTSDAISFVDSQANEVTYVEQSVRLWDQVDGEQPADTFI